MLVEGQVGHQLLEFTVLLLHLAEAPQLDDTYARELALPAVKRLLAHPQLAADLDRRGADFRLAQGVDDLLLGKRLFFLVVRPSVG